MRDRPYQDQEEAHVRRDNSFVALILILALLCILSPIDLIPDFIPVVGWAVDLAVGVGGGAAALAAGPR